MGVGVASKFVLLDDLRGLSAEFCSGVQPSEAAFRFEELEIRGQIEQARAVPHPGFH